MDTQRKTTAEGWSRSASIATFFLAVFASQAQVGTTYGFIGTTGTYADISGGTDVNTIEVDEAISGNIPIGFTFVFDGVSYTQCRASSNGWLSLGTSATGALPANNLSAGTPGRPFIAPLWDDLSGVGGFLNIGRGVAKYQTTGTAGNRIFHMQWREWKWDRGMNNLTNTISFSCKLYETTNVIEFVYQQELSGNNNGSGGASIGICGAATGMNHFLSLNGTGTSPSASGTTETTNLGTRPASNQLYRFLPCRPPVVATSTALDCSTGTYTVSVNVSDIGSAPNIDLVSSVSGVFANDVGTGSYTAPALAAGTAQTITVVHNGNSVCNLSLGTFNPTGNCVTNGSCLTPGAAIPDDGCGTANVLNAIIPITAPGTLLNSDVLLSSVDLVVAHTYNSDLEIRLTSPTGQTRNLVLDRFGSGDNLGIPAQCPNAVLRLQDGGAAMGTGNQSNVTGVFAPAQTLAGFTGNPNGEWTLSICDDEGVDIGQLRHVRLNFMVMGSTDRCAPRIIACGEQIAANSTAGAPLTLPVNSCAFNGPPSTGGVHWWSYTANAHGEVLVSLCGTASFNSRVSVFRPSPSCTDPTCVAMGDDAPGCPGNSSDVRFLATAGETYLIAVHGSGAAVGTYSIALECQPACAPSVANDHCPTALALGSVLADGLTPPLDQDNICAHVDGPTTSSGTAPVVGNWYTFNAGTHTRHRLRLINHSILPSYTATVIGYALYAGTCTGLGASNELVSTGATGQYTDLPLLTPGADYRLLVYNNGSLSQAGSFAVLVDHPGHHDAGVTLVSAPAGVVCGTEVGPVVTLRNFGETDLGSVILRVSIDGNPVLDHPWTGSLAYGASTTVNLPAVPTPAGQHTLQVTVLSPNGQADEIASNDQASSNYDATGELARVVIHTDGAGSDITWALYDPFFFPIVSGGPYGNNTTISSVHCLPTTFGSCYTFFLFDSSGDGLCCGNGEGSWEIRDGADRLLLGDQFLATGDGTQSPAVSTLSPQYLGHEFCLPGGPTNILPNECGIFNNTLENKVYCSPVPGAVNYQFEFSDPDVGFLRRIAVPRPWVKFGEMVSVPLQPGVRYFCRARVDQGANGFADDRFGGGCDMGIDPDQVPGCTQLINDPTLPTHSCGVTRSFGGSDKVWAQPVVGGTAYRFKFSNPGEGYNRIIQRPTYVCVLNWVTQPLVNGQYEVTVEVLVNGQWSGYCGGACTITILNPDMLLEQGRATKAEEQHLLLFPNPAREGHVTLRMDGLAEADQDVIIEVFTLTGERLLFQQFLNEGDVLNRAIELPASMATGTYLVRVNVDGHVSAHRLNVIL